MFTVRNFARVVVYSVCITLQMHVLHNYHYTINSFEILLKFRHFYYILLLHVTL